MSTRRNVLSQVSKSTTTHPCLWLDKYISEQSKDDTASRRDLVDEVATLQPTEEYKQFYERWSPALATLGAEMRPATVQGRMAVGLGEESVLETSVCLHHTYGVPYIPGSALKGLAAAYARQKLNEQAWSIGSEAYRVLFGDTAEAGYVTFFDALYVPGSGDQGRALHADVITVHHPDYYQKGDSAPADWDSPTPISFLSATGKYLIALAGPAEWVAAAFEILGLALQEMGIGAKTSSGYGRMAFDAHQQSVEQPAAMVDANEQIVARFIQGLSALPNGQVAPQIQQFGERWRKAEVGDEHKQRMAQAVVDKIRAAGREKALSSKPWYSELLDKLPK
jgi:CRISPR-associated protein Cmr6